MDKDAIEEDPVAAFWHRAEWLAMGADSQGGPDLSGQKEYIALWEDFYEWAQTEGADHPRVPITIEVYKDKIERLKERLRYDFMNEVNGVLLDLIKWRENETHISTMAIISKGLKELPAERRAAIEAENDPAVIFQKLVAMADEKETNWKVRVSKLEANWGDIFWTKKMARRLDAYLEGDSGSLAEDLSTWAKSNNAEMREIKAEHEMKSE